VQAERQHHLQVTAGDVGEYVLLPGDPGRCEAIARRFDSPRQVASNREFNTWSGLLDGVRVSVTSTGIGCPSTVIAVEELARVGQPRWFAWAPPVRCNRTSIRAIWQW